MKPGDHVQVSDDNVYHRDVRPTWTDAIVLSAGRQGRSRPGRRAAFRVVVYHIPTGQKATYRRDAVRHLEHPIVMATKKVGRTSWSLALVPWGGHDPTALDLHAKHTKSQEAQDRVVVARLQVHHVWHAE